MLDEIISLIESTPDRMTELASWALSQIGRIWLPVYDWILQQRADFLIEFAGFIVLIALCVLVNYLYFKSMAKRAEADADKWVNSVVKHPLTTWVRMILIFYYYPLMLYIGYLMTGGLDLNAKTLEWGERIYGFFNLADWMEMYRVPASIALCQLVLSSAVYVLRLRFIRLFRLLLNTATAMFTGAVLGKIFMLLAQMVAEIPILGPVTVLMSGYALQTAVPFFLNLTAFLPITGWLYAVIASPIQRICEAVTGSFETSSGKVYRVNILLALLYDITDAFGI